MAYVVQVPFADQEESLLIEVNPAAIGGGIELVSDDPALTVARATRTVEQCLTPIKAFLEAAVDRMQELTRSPDELEVEFALGLAGEAGFFFTKGSAEASIKVKATWKASEED